MNLHEYQGKSILESFGVAIQRGVVVDNAADAVAKAKELSKNTGTEWFVVKAQIHAGGRGKGIVTETQSNGVVLAKGIDHVEEKVKGILGGHLVTKQTNDQGKKVNKVLIAEDVYYPGASEPSEFYMSVLLDREKERNMIVYSTEGGMDIETVAEETPHLIHKEEIDPKVGLQGFQARRIAFNLGLSGQAF
jgi:succinyl-CoA synthetase beta subunit